MAVIFGLVILIWPGISLLFLIAIFGLYALADGVFAILVALLPSRTESRTWLLIFEGILEILVGLIVLLRPGFSAFAVVYVVALWAVALGLLRIVRGLTSRPRSETNWIQILSGILLLFMGGPLVVLPGAGLLSFIWLLGFGAIIVGILMIVIAVQDRRENYDANDWIT